MEAVTKFEATNYRGEYTYEGMTGSFSANANKDVMSISGSKPDIGSFEAYRNETGFSYDLHPYDLHAITELVATLEAAIAQVQQDIKE